MADNPIGAAEDPLAFKASAANPDADPDLERWQADRWAPHGDLNVPATGERWEHARGDGSYHDLTLDEQEREAEREAERPKPKRRRSK